MSSIRIVGTPSGDAPLEIREAWVGLELPVERIDANRLVGGVLTGQPKVLGHAYSVNFNEAMHVLADNDQMTAVSWWISVWPPRSFEHDCLVFDGDCCEPIAELIT